MQILIKTSALSKYIASKKTGRNVCMLIERWKSNRPPGGMAEECRAYHSRLAELLADKKGKSTPWTKLSFALLRSALLYLGGSRATRKIYTNLQDTDFAVKRGLAEIY